MQTVATAHRLSKVAPLTTVVAPSRLSSAALDGVRLLLSQPPLQRLSSGRLRHRGADQSFRPLVVASQTTNIKLYDVAEFLVRTDALASRKP